MIGCHLTFTRAVSCAKLFANKVIRRKHDQKQGQLQTLKSQSLESICQLTCCYPGRLLLSEIQIQLKVGIKQMSECLGDARYTKSIYALLSRFIVWSLLCYCVRDKDHCCVLYDVTRDLLFAWYIVHQPNVYQYRALIYLASLSQRRN